MEESWDLIMSIIIPLTILNLIGTGLVMLLWDCIKLIHKIEDYDIIPNSTDENHTYTPPDDSKLDHESPIVPVETEKISEKDHTSEVIVSNEKSPDISNIRDELSGDNASLENIAETLISITQKLAGSVSETDNIPSDKKQEISKLLKGFPGFITKIIDMDEKEIDSILWGMSSQHRTNSSEDHRKESEYLMKTLESLESLKNK